MTDATESNRSVESHWFSAESHRGTNSQVWKATAAVILGTHLFPMEVFQGLDLIQHAIKPQGLDISHSGKPTFHITLLS